MNIHIYPIYFIYLYTFSLSGLNFQNSPFTFARMTQEKLQEMRDRLAVLRRFL